MGKRAMVGNRAQVQLHDPRLTTLAPRENEDGTPWISTKCQRGTGPNSHGNCFSLKCGCACHKRVSK